ncbi:MAG: hydroxyphenylacetyl-CoA thioesterase PaaI [Candidatus Sumerlaeia bacterium]|nr:hydroxyphenylacetyl-CoA thioesterase PaaI [Candidatus Sumerlaeia bacterium]
MDEARRQAILAQLKFDRFAAALGIEVVALDDGYARCRMTVRPDMLNSVDIPHGGCIFTLADMAFAAACNSHGTVALALHVDITFYAAAPAGSVLFAEAKEVYLGRKTSEYDIRVTAEDGHLIAAARGLAYRKSDPYPPRQ